MATAGQNLSDYDPTTVPNGREMKIGIVVSEWNDEITNRLLEGAHNTLLKHEVIADNILVRRVPGSFELPLGAQFMAENTDVDGIICIGTVIRGETSHFDYVCQAAMQGIKDVGLKYNMPVIFGVLTDDNKEQSLARSGGALGNKGDEAAVTCLKMIALKEGF